MNDRASRLFLLAVQVALLAGCQRGEPIETIIEPQDRVEQNPVVVTVVDRAGYDAVLVSLRGRIVFVDCWASWCVPCMEQLPHTLKLATSSAELAVVTLCFDDPEKSTQISRILASQGTTEDAVHLVSEHGGSSRSMEEFEVPGGALPHYKLYDRTGKLRRTFKLDPSAERQFTTADIQEAVDELLGEATAN